MIEVKMSEDDLMTCRKWIHKICLRRS